ncbi:hypothetical protein BLA18112_01447 [Burkholderia lata]|uniref:Uncharacterized protein n=1 Tax=Burkholderia lata (strain ATCC 17760 / DSM 23089 / LMG 22485 / NCIMB 9086 / R18194 / 383) TaxID=482957 RepID=A0A6P2U3Q3_BURL3|nr:hypothetical protein [Burkholderia lata]VWC64168.1 hypothetical protein BLA18112_01447 [Burkholderia lata]
MTRHHTMSHGVVLALALASSVLLVLPAMPVEGMTPPGATMLFAWRVAWTVLGAPPLIAMRGN